MEIRRLVEEIAADKYPGCDYVRERVKKELDFLERTERFKEIETLVEVKELVGEKQFFVSEGSLLVLYLLGLSVVNPMPAHYYNRNTKEIIFDGSKNYGVDLPEKDGFVRDGFNIPEDYTIHQREPFYMETEIDDKHKDKVIELIKKKFELKYEKRNYIESRIFKPEVVSEQEKITFLDTSIAFVDFKYKMGWYEAEEADELREFAIKSFMKMRYLDSKILRNVPHDEYERTKAMLKKIKSFDDVVYFRGREDNKLEIKNKEFSDDSIKHIYQTNRQDVFKALLENGYDIEKAAEMARELSFGKTYDFSNLNSSLGKYLSGITMQFSKDAIVRIIIKLFIINKCEAERLSEAESELFKEWDKKYDCFISDGIVNFRQYAAAPLKITCILKEVNAIDGFKWSLTDFINKGACGATWNVVSRWIAGILFGKSFDEVEDIDEKKRKKYLAPISVINLKKTPGGAESDDEIIAKFARDDKENIKKELKLYDPDIVICCGTGNVFAKEILEREHFEWTQVSKDVFYIWDNNRLIIYTWHPQQRAKGRDKEYMYEKIVPLIRNIIRDVGAYNGYRC